MAKVSWRETQKSGLAYQPFQEAHHLVYPAKRFRRQAFAEFKTFATHAEHEARRRLPAFGLAKDLQDGLRRQGVGGVAGNGRRENRLVDIGGRGIFAGIDEQRLFPAHQVEGVLDVELEILDQLDTLASANDSDGQRLSAEQLHMRKHQAAALAKNDYGDMAADVAAKAESTLKYLDTAIAAAEEYEQQQAEIERMRTEQAAREQADHEAKIAAEAAEKARAEAEAKAKAEREASERARIEAQLKAEQAERDKQAAIDRAEAEKQAAVQAERLRIESEAAQAEKAAAERAANVENQRKVNRSVMAAMLECGIEEEAAKAFLIKVVQGKVPHLKINY